jgi:hypothetical protein
MPLQQIAENHQLNLELVLPSSSLFHRRHDRRLAAAGMLPSLKINLLMSVPQPASSKAQQPGRAGPA